MTTTNSSYYTFHYTSTCVARQTELEIVYTAVTTCIIIIITIKVYIAKLSVPKSNLALLFLYSNNRNAANIQIM